LTESIVQNKRDGSQSITIRDLNQQRRIEAYARNSTPARTEILSWAADFSDVFNRESFESLPERQTWDHTIELVPDAKPANYKVYSISLLEQKELNAFITDGLSTGRIRPSKSPIASQVFFVKKEDRASVATETASHKCAASRANFAISYDQYLYNGKQLALLLLLAS
jgi:hypothetical protein